MNKRALWLITLPTVLLTSSAIAQHPEPQRPFGTLREQARIQQQWLTVRLDSVLPQLMRQHGINMWVVAMREYNEDPVFRALVSPTTFAARRRTIYMFFDRGPEHGLERLALGGSSQAGSTRPCEAPSWHRTAASASCGVGISGTCSPTS
jgi:hypothetical protein